MLAPTKKYTQENQFYLNEAQSSVFFKTDKVLNSYNEKSYDEVIIG